MKLYETYWDVLPPEIQDYVFAFKLSQEYLDEVRAKLIFNLRVEITMYGELKQKWGIGHIRCISPFNICNVCKERHSTRIMACYVDECNVKQEYLLGYRFPEAMRRVSTIKSFL